MRLTRCRTVEAIIVGTRTAGGDVDLWVSDTGAGMTQEECARLFTPYYTTESAWNGAWLAIAQSVVSDHGGRISVESTKESGTTFRIELPRNAP